MKRYRMVASETRHSLRSLSAITTQELAPVPDSTVQRSSKSPDRRMLYCVSSSRHVVPVAAVIQSSVGEWLSLVEHLVRDQGVGGSNPLSPTNLFLII
jgi:hypothetical protein